MNPAEYLGILQLRCSIHSYKMETRPSKSRSISAQLAYASLAC